MTSATVRTRSENQQPGRGLQTEVQSAVTTLDLLTGSALVVLVVLGWISLVLADLGGHYLVAVVLLTIAVLGVSVFAIARWARPRVVSDRAGVLVALACAAVAVTLSFPGFAYGVSDKDPGGYVQTAMSIEHHHAVAFIDPLLATAAKDPTFPVPLVTPGARFAGIWVHNAKTGEIVPQFYHLSPALMATAYEAFGLRGLTNTIPVVGVVSTLLMCALLRRVGTALAGRSAGLVAAGFGGALMATNMLQVWMSRYPTTEIISQALFLGALLGIVVVLQTGWRPAAAIGGLSVGVGWLNRADGLLLVLMCLAVGSTLIAARRWNASTTWFATGLAVVTPHAVWQAYGIAKTYTLVNLIPPLSTVCGLLAVGLVAGFAVRQVLPGPVGGLLRSLEKRRVQIGFGVLLLFSAAALMAIGFLRTRLFGFSYIDYNGRLIRSYDEAILRRLSWFFTVPGLALFLVGLGVVAVRRWSASIWVVVLPCVALFAVYGYSAKNSTRLLWWSRRYVPTVLPGFIILVTLALAFFVVHRFAGRALLRVPAVLAFLALVGVFLSQSLPLRSHNEWDGSFAISKQIADLAGNEQGVFFWASNQSCCAAVTSLFATPVWLQRDQISALLPDDATQLAQPAIRRSMIARYSQRFPGQPMFLVSRAGFVPAGIDPGSLEPVAHIQKSLPFWEESDVHRPAKQVRVPFDISIWKIRTG